MRRVGRGSLRGWYMACLWLPPAWLVVGRSELRRKKGSIEMALRFTGGRNRKRGFILKELGRSERAWLDGNRPWIDATLAAAVLQKKKRSKETAALKNRASGRSTDLITHPHRAAKQTPTLTHPAIQSHAHPSQAARDRKKQRRRRMAKAPAAVLAVPAVFPQQQQQQQ